MRTQDLLIRDFDVDCFAGALLPGPHSKIMTFTHNKLLHREAFTHSKRSHAASVYTQNPFTQCFYTWQAFTHTTSFLSREAFTHREAFTQRSFYTEKLLHTASFHTQPVFTHRTLAHSAFTHGKRLHTQQAF